MKVLIIGSCVTRDAFELLESSTGIKVVEYFARTSLGSLFAEPLSSVDLSGIKSNFQKRIVEYDLEKHFLNYIDTADFDLLIYDPIDERFNLLDYGDGVRVTLSNESSVVLDRNAASTIASGSDSFYSYWEDGWRKLLDLLRKKNKYSSLLVNNVQWSERTESGASFDKSHNSVAIAKANAFLNKLYSRMRQDLDESHFIHKVDDLFVGADTHKWGVSPFHYINAPYERLIKRLDEEKNILGLGVMPVNRIFAKIKTEVIGDVVSVSLLSDGLEEGDLFYYYLTSKGKVVARSPNWLTEPSFQFDLTNTGSYIIQGYVRRGNDRKVFYSEIFHYISQEAIKDRKRYVLAERPEKLQTRNVIWYREVLTGSEFEITDIVAQESVISQKEGTVELSFAASDVTKTFQVSVESKELREANGFGIEFFIDGWDSIEYMALGFREANHYFHVKQLDVTQSEKQNIFVSFNDFSWNKENKNCIVDPQILQKIRLYIKGRPTKDTLCLVSNIWIWLEEVEPELFYEPIKEPLSLVDADINCQLKKNELIVNFNSEQLIDEDVFYFYLLDDSGNIVARSEHWNHERTYQFQLNKTGGYKVQGYIRRGNERRVYFSEDLHYISLASLQDREKYNFEILPKILESREIDWYRELLSGIEFEQSDVISKQGALSIGDAGIELTFSGFRDIETYQFSIKTHEFRPLNGLGLRLKVSGWEKINYVAIGFLDGEVFRHVKLPKIRQGIDHDFSVGFQDIAWYLSNEYQYLDPLVINNVLIYIKGQTGLDSVCEISKVWVWREDELSESIWGGENIVVESKVLNGLPQYLVENYINSEQRAEEFLINSLCPLAAGTVLPWAINEAFPKGLDTDPSWQFSWHSLQPAGVLLLHSKQKDCLTSLMAARDFVTQWIITSYDRLDTNRYVWYEHGVAQRTLVLLFLYALGERNQFDQRALKKLRFLIYRHAQLLSSEFFYAYNQPYRYHNHAWFQDVALLFVSLAFPSWPGSESWKKLALERLEDQLETLIVKEAKYSVLTENAIAYHTGIAKMVSKLDQLSKDMGLISVFEPVKDGMLGFVNLVLYPDGKTVFAQGDTPRDANPTTYTNKKVIRDSESPEGEFTFLKETGYFIAKSKSKAATSYQFSLFATNLNATHKHQDDLSFVFWLDGIEWLIDPSYYSYNVNDDLAVWLRTPEAHNMLSIPCEDYRITPFSGRSELTMQKTAERHVVLTGSNRSYEDYLIQRKMEIFEDQHGLPNIRVKDFFTQLNSKGNNVAEGVLSFHIGDGVKIHRHTDGMDVHFYLSHPLSNKKLILKLIGLSDDQQIKIEPSWSGTSFLGKVKTQRIEVALPVDTELEWSLTVAQL